VWLKISNTQVIKDYNNDQAQTNENSNTNVEISEEPQLVINGQTFLVEVATDSAVQKKGLSARDSLAASQGMLFAYPAKSILSFWMIDMRFNIDLLWINDDIVIGIEKNMLVPAPGTQDEDLLIYSSPEPVNRVLEINAGLVDKYGLKIGDKLEYKNINF